ncbi:sorting nexin Mvp1 [Saccharata proteae CBS 121410]|uniref:Sorting nexin MVP1 n=1 Tax=Saccharata proteae CBS 121410 TaxID=1314787 RepID=A0A9P4HW31_9PEZI|nr:sorting nexin Mvp1 [Saccharata proteae CBS 121410]
MSLFGEDDDLPRRQKSSLFDDEPTPTSKGASSLFADDLDNDDASSPWAFPTPKKAPRGNVVKTLLPSDEVPEIYITAYDALLVTDRLGSGISLTGIKAILKDCDLSADVQSRILDIVVQSGQESTEGLGRGEFNVLVALIGLAQESEDITLDGVDDRRRSKSSVPAPPAVASRIPTPPAATKENVPSTPRTAPRKPSFGLDADPWNSPEEHKDHHHEIKPDPPSRTTTYPGYTNGNGAPTRTTTGFSTSTAPPESTLQEPRPQTSNGNSAWGAYGSSAEGFAGPGLGGDGFGGPRVVEGNNNNSINDPTGLGRSLGGGRIANNGVDEIVTVNAIAEKEGIFLFQHRNYEVTSIRRNTKVIRRYSDFVWLLDCLHKKYPFRQLPLLPPKRVAINGNYLAADNSFVEKRRRGLVRFVNALVRHPVLSQEQLVIMFLTVPTELAAWRKQANLSVQEEFTDKALPPTLEDSLPANLQELFDTVRSGVRRSAEMYINLCTLLERLAKRNEGVAADYLRFSLALQALTEASADTYAVDTNDVPLLNEGLTSTAKHLSTSQSLLEDEARAWDEGVLEDLKRQRDCLVSMRDLFDRRDRLDKDNIPTLERRIQNNEVKLQTIRNKPAEMVKPGEAEKVADAIVRDKQSIVNQHARGVFIKECIRDELLYFQQSQYHISKLHQDWSQERVKYAELQADNWRRLSEEVEGMPLGD